VDEGRRHLEIEIERIGTLSNPIVAEAHEPTTSFSTSRSSATGRPARWPRRCWAGGALKVYVCERLKDVYEIPRAIALDHEIMRVFQQLGVVDAISPSASPSRHRSTSASTAS
jgi:hydroxyacyl-ACP dehydratase HTD2-like protein with hotdog domain